MNSRQPNNADKSALVTQPDRPRYAAFIFNLIVILLLNAGLFYTKLHFSAQLASVEYVFFIGQIIIYAWIFILLANLYHVHYSAMAMAISSDIFLKIIVNYFAVPVEPEIVTFVFWLILVVVGRLVIRLNEDRPSLVFVINLSFQLLILKEFVFYLPENNPVYYLSLSVLMWLIFYLAGRTSKADTL